MYELVIRMFFAINDIDAIIVPIGNAFYSYTINVHIIAPFIMRYPTGGVLECNPGDLYVAAIFKV